jgi:acyl-CoA reductase-like NAD-dependent aldehyde dehydrogenase
LPNRSNSAWSDSTPASSQTPQHPSAALKQSGLGREGGSEGIAGHITAQCIGIADRYAS